MKKIIFALLLVSAIIAAGLTGCSSAADEQSPTVSVTTAPTPSKNPTPASSETPAKTEPTPDEGINWINDWDEALNRAQTENKPMMINFYTDTCPACVKLDNDTFTDEKLANLVNENFINVKSNAGRTPLHANYGLA
ncbi:MAG: thioredoxin family protein, partial [Chloroflexota bacterium]|nr:thioredoxin family protein [Chloroflexota bacterium]